MKRINTILCILLLSLGVTNISLTSFKDNGNNISQKKSTVNAKYEYIKQDGYIDLGYIVEEKNNQYLKQRSSINMVNFDMNTRSQSFENFDPDSYAKRSDMNSLSHVEDSIGVNDDETFVHSTTVNGKKCSYTEGYLPNVNNNLQISILTDTTDPNDKIGRASCRERV